MQVARPCRCVAGTTDTRAAGDGDDERFADDDEPFEAPEWHELVWGTRDAPIPAAWLQQRLLFDGVGLVQDRNGPCGPLAVINAELLARMLEREGVRIRTVTCAG